MTAEHQGVSSEAESRNLGAKLSTRQSLLRVVSGRVLAAARVRESETSYALQWSQEFLISTSGRLLGVVLLALLILLFLWSIVKFPYFSPVSLVEEAASTYTSARNYLTYGFLNSGLLQDFSNSSSRLDHPYVYDHYPPGPDILTALLLGISGGNFRFVRLVLGGILLLGIVVYLQFARLVLREARLPGSSYTVLFLGPWMLMQNFDRHTASPQPLLIFGPLVALSAYYRARRVLYLYLCMGIAFVSSLYLDYQVLIAAIFCWLLLYLTQLIRIDRRHLVAFYGLVGCGISLHLLQNFLYLGPAAFLAELWKLLGNRILGSPSQEGLDQFYRSVGLVNHGAHSLHVTTLLSQLWVNLTFPFPGRMVIVPTVALALAWAVAGALHYDPGVGALILPRGQATWYLGFFARLAAWICVTVMMPVLLFPAFAQEVNLYGARTNFYFLAIGGVAGLVYTLQQIVQRRPVASPPGASSLRVRWVASIAIWIVVVLGFGLSIGQIVRGDLGQLRQVVSALKTHRYADLTDLRRFAGHVYMTNINTPTVGFFVREAGFGVCGLRSLPDTGGIDPTWCKIADVRRYDLFLRREPRYFFLFLTPDLFPGFGDCLPSGTLVGALRGGDSCVALMKQRLSQQFPSVFKNNLFEVYDLKGPLGPAPPTGLGSGSRGAPPRLPEPSHE